MAQKIERTNVERQSGFLYFIDKDGDVAASPMARGGRGSKKKGGGKAKKIARVGIKKEKGYLYFLDGDGDVARAKMVRR